MATNSFDLSGNEKDSYLGTLDTTLRVLASHAETDILQKTHEAIRTLDAKRDLSGFAEAFVSDTTARIEDVRTAYSMFRSIDGAANPRENRLYADSVSFDSTTGMPFSFAVRELLALKQRGMRDFEALDFKAATRAYAEVFLGDKQETTEAITTAAHRIREGTLRENFRRTLANTELFDLFGNNPVQARIVSHQPEEEIWVAQYWGFPMYTAIPQLNTVVFAQEPDCNVFTVGPRGYAVKPEFALPILNQELNSAYTLERIAQEAQGLHPLAMSRLFIGPFDSPYITHAQPEVERLETFKEISANDSTARFLRASRHYAFAPDHAEVQAGAEWVRKQIVDKKQQWRDEIIIAPTQHSKLLSERLLGKNVHIYEYEATQ
jgi:hypothetical protein